MSFHGSSALPETRFINDLSVPSGVGSLLSVYGVDWASSKTLWAISSILHLFAIFLCSLRMRRSGLLMFSGSSEV